MKICLLARPDHSVSLFEELRTRGVDVDLQTFYAFRRGSLWNRLFPNRKSVPATASTALTFTLLAYVTTALGQRIDFNWRRAHRVIGDALLRPRGLAQADVVHYWPFYYDDVVRHLKTVRPEVATLADYYEAEPSYVNALFRHAYEAVGLSFANPINTMIDQNAAFEFENNFVVPSEFARRSYQRMFPTAAIHVVSYGLLGKTITVRKRSAHKTRWVFVGRIGVEKGVHILLDAMSRSPELELDLIGSIDERQRAYFETRLRSARNVRFLGHMRNVEVQERLPGYDAFVMPSLSDSYSIATIEAASCGMPVVVSDNCGVADEVARYGLGRVCKTNDATDLVASMQQVSFETDDESLDAGLRAFEAAERHEPYAVRMLQLYRKLARWG